jgi:small subunit ribosomal protein S17
MAKKQLIGKIISDKMQKTVVVLVEKRKEQTKYRTRYQTHKKYKAHDEKGEYKVGDVVLIEECRPISKEKRWRVIKKITSDIGEGSGELVSSPVKENNEQSES